MLTAVQRLRLYSLSIVVVVLIVAIAFNVIARRRLDDVRVLNEVRTFADSMEHYKQDTWQYPEQAPIDLRNTTVLTENGFASGSRVYYRGAIKSHKPVVFKSTSESYAISFSLRRAWPDEGLISKSCIMTQNATLACSRQ